MNFDSSGHDNVRLFTKMICVDTRARDPTQSDNDFDIVIPRITNVVSISLQSAEVSNRLYDINTDNNVLDFHVNVAASVAAIVPAGVYNGTELASALQIAIDAVSLLPPGTIPVTFDSKTNRITFSVTGGNTLVLEAGTGSNLATSIYTAIGFDATDITGITTSQTGQNTVQLKEGEHYIYLNLATLGSMESTDYDTDIFAKLVTDDLNKFKHFISVPKTYSVTSPLPSLSTLHVQFKRRDGSLYNLRNDPASFTLQVKYVQ